MNLIKFLMKKTAAPPSAFVFEVQTTGADETFSLPLEASGTYAFNVDWGDDSDNDITTYNQAEVTHTYTSAGTYEISIIGTIIGWNFYVQGDATNRNRFYELKNWGPLRVGNNEAYFYDCPNLTIIATDILDLTGTTTLRSMFVTCTSLVTVPSICSWNTALIESTQSMFYYASLFDQDLGSLNITSVTDMVAMLDGVTLSTANYDALWIGWKNQEVQDNVNFHGGNSKYSAGAAAAARQSFIDDHNWSILDGGQV